MVVRLARFTHGGRIVEAARDAGLPPGEILDFSASINPLGVPPEVMAAIREALPGIVHYPEVDGESLTEALAGHHGLDRECLLPGNGSTELIYLLPQVLRPRRALIVTPAFSEYERSLELAGVAVDFFPLAADQEFRLHSDRLLAALASETEMVVLGNPGNPTGAGIDPELIETVARSVRKQALVVVDEAFVDFCPRRSVLERVPDHGNLYVLRSLTKFFAIPGLRAGYLAGPKPGVARLATARPPWTLSTLALEAARTCLRQTVYRQRTLELIPRLRGQLAAGMADLGLTVFPGEANFLLVRLEGAGQTAAELSRALLAKGILIRDCANFPALDERYFRVAVRSEADNARLLGALADIFRDDRP